MNNNISKVYIKLKHAVVIVNIKSFAKIIRTSVSKIESKMGICDPVMIFNGIVFPILFAVTKSITENHGFLTILLMSVLMFKRNNYIM